MNGSSSLHGPEVAYLPGGHDVSPGTAEKVVSSAKSWEGTPYPVPDDAKPGDYGGVNATKGFGGDCSGSQHAIANEAGIPIGYAKAGAYGALAATPGTPIRALSRNELANPQPGDVLHFSYPFNHVATAVGDGTMETAHSARANQRGQYYSNTPVAAFGVPDAGYRYQQ
jgi:cell wall-associated NlpC family hydrolase